MRVVRPVHPGGRPKMLYVAGRDGILDFGQDRDMAYITTRLFLPATNKRTQLRQIAAWLNQSEVKQLIFSDEPDKFYLARPSAMVNPEEVGNRVWLDIVWVCPDPYAYSLTTKTTTPNGGTAPTPVKITATMTDDTDHLQINLGDQH
ncbi:MAG TPA: phage tail family protein, partial [Bacillota bacterium]|nr:phage tail family protein [Bacillota bacterium]